MWPQWDYKSLTNHQVQSDSDKLSICLTWNGTYGARFLIITLVVVEVFIVVRPSLWLRLHVAHSNSLLSPLSSLLTAVRLTQRCPPSRSSLTSSESETIQVFYLSPATSLHYSCYKQITENSANQRTFEPCIYIFIYLFIWINENDDTLALYSYNTIQLCNEERKYSEIPRIFPEQETLVPAPLPPHWQTCVCSLDQQRPC